MSEIWKSQPMSVYEAWCDAVMDEASEQLTDWETEFITNIKNQLVMGRSLSEKQAKILEKIYTEKTK